MLSEDLKTTLKRPVGEKELEFAPNVIGYFATRPNPAASPGEPGPEFSRYPRRKIRKRENIYSYDHYHEVFLSHTNRLTLLKHPYRFNCIDYKESQLACLENCANRSYQHFHHLDLNTIGKILTANEITYCSHACAKPDCKSLNLRIEEVGKIKNKDNSTSIDILANLHETSIQYLPAFSLPELILYLLGVVGLWSGLSLLDLPKIFMMFIDKCKEINLYRKQTIVRKFSSYDTD